MGYVLHYYVITILDWLCSLSVREFYRHGFEEAKIDGNLLISLGDEDLQYHLAIDSRATRKKILRQMVAVLEKELRVSWFKLLISVFECNIHYY